MTVSLMELVSRSSSNSTPHSNIEAIRVRKEHNNMRLNASTTKELCPSYEIHSVLFETFPSLAPAL